MYKVYSELELLTESDVEQKFIYRLLTEGEPIGLGYSDTDFRTKPDIRKLAIDKGANKKLYYPDYAIIVDGVPSVIVEAKKPGEDIDEALREARLYANEINASYPKNINPCEKIVVTDGMVVAAGYCDRNKIEIFVESKNFSSVDTNFSALIDFLSKKTVLSRSQDILLKIKKSAKYYKPVYLLGGKSVKNETVGENSFGANISVEYKCLFNPDTAEDRAAIVQNAYVKSKRKLSHISPIDKIVRAAIPEHIINARSLQDTEFPTEITEQLSNTQKISNEICLLIGSVGSGKSTFTDYLRIKALPESIRLSTEWVNLNLNKAPLSRELIYTWIVSETINEIKKNHSKIDFDSIEELKKIYSKELEKTEKIASLYPKDSEKYIDVIYNEITRLQHDHSATLRGIINHYFVKKNKLLVIVLDNCDKRNRDDQLLMFEVASWLKSSFLTMVFLPIRDTTYDQFRNEPPLDTVIKDLVFRIDPPLLDRVIYERLNYVLREIQKQNTDFVYFLPNDMKVVCSRVDIGKYLKSMIASLFQDRMFKRIISGIAGRNIRKGLEIILYFCKSGHISESEILKVRQSNGDYRLPNYLIAKILLKGKRKYYSDQESHIKNLFNSDSEDSLPDPFVRIAILEWLHSKFREYGPNKTKGFHKVGSLVQNLQSYGHSHSRILIELSSLILSGCVSSEAQKSDINIEDLVSISPAGIIHLELLKNISYLSAISEDTLFRENQVAKSIADNLIGRGKFRNDSKQSQISNAKYLIDYMNSYHKSYFMGYAKILKEDTNINDDYISNIYDYVTSVAGNDYQYCTVKRLEDEYPPGLQVAAQVVSIQKYGFFVEFGLNGTGLVHKSKLKNIESLDSYEEGDWVEIEVIKYNRDHKKFDLKLVDSQN
ncbi:S1 RNA-binding domain-containing protein [Spartinivicinus ruber]|uniref:S1 RNA-binding domain-containing protein n=1 Tax=Spartinivicinus ruber TaxID=2683272 RepID=UPI0013D11001|nr:S1 RNA-binding domain-containing protein [Spartinivicinus ruber]